MLNAHILSFNSQASYEARPSISAAWTYVTDVSIHRPHTRPDHTSGRHLEHHLVSIHRPHTRPDFPTVQKFRFAHVSIHRPHTRPDVTASMPAHGHTFVSIHRPHTRPDAIPLPCPRPDGVSIHRPHTRPDRARPPVPRIHSCFNSQASYEARHAGVYETKYGKWFQFTGLIRGPTTRYQTIQPDLLSFNSQASYEARLSHSTHDGLWIMFQFTGLIRGPTENVFSTISLNVVSIHRPHTRPDMASATLRHPYTVSIHRPHTRPDAVQRIDEITA